MFIVFVVFRLNSLTAKNCINWCRTTIMETNWWFRLKKAYKISFKLYITPSRRHVSKFSQPSKNYKENDIRDSSQLQQHLHSLASFGNLNCQLSANFLTAFCWLMNEYPRYEWESLSQKIESITWLINMKREARDESLLKEPEKFQR